MNRGTRFYSRGTRHAGTSLYLGTISKLIDAKKDEQCSSGGGGGQNYQGALFVL